MRCGNIPNGPMRYCRISVCVVYVCSFIRNKIFVFRPHRTRVAVCLSLGFRHVLCVFLFYFITDQMHWLDVRMLGGKITRSVSHLLACNTRASTHRTLEMCDCNNSGILDCIHDCRSFCVQVISASVSWMVISLTGIIFVSREHTHTQIGEKLLFKCSR